MHELFPNNENVVLIVEVASNTSRLGCYDKIYALLYALVGTKYER